MQLGSRIRVSYTYLWKQDKKEKRRGRKWKQLFLKFKSDPMVDSVFCNHIQRS